MNFDNREAIVTELAQTRGQLIALLVELSDVEKLIGEAPSTEHLQKLMHVRAEIERAIKEKQVYLAQLRKELRQH